MPPRRTGTETASRSTSDTAPPSATPSRHDDHLRRGAEAVPRGRELGDQLRAHDARKLFEQAAAKDPNFALAHYDLAINSPTPEGVPGAPQRGGRALGQGVRGRASHDPGASGRQQRRLQEVAGVHRGARRQVSARRARALRCSASPTRASRSSTKRSRTRTKATEVDPKFAPAYNPLGYAYMPQAKYAEAETGVQEVHRARPERSESLRLVRRAADADGAVRRVDRASTGRRCRSSRTSATRTSASPAT